MTNLPKFSNDQCSQIFYDLIENHHIETYEDASTMCRALRDYAIACLSAEDTDDAVWDIPERDSVTRQNLTHVVHLLEVCSSLFIESDDYYRSM